MPRLDPCLGGDTVTGSSARAIVYGLKRANPFNQDVSDEEFSTDLLAIIRACLGASVNLPDVLAHDPDVLLALYVRAGLGRYVPLPLTEHDGKNRARALELEGWPERLVATVPGNPNAWEPYADGLRVITFDGRAYAIERRDPKTPGWSVCVGFFDEVASLDPDGEQHFGYTLAVPRFDTIEAAIEAARRHDARTCQDAADALSAQRPHPEIGMPDGPLTEILELERAWVDGAEDRRAERDAYDRQEPIRVAERQAAAEDMSAAQWVRAGLPGIPESATFLFTPRAGEPFDSWAYVYRDVPWAFSDAKERSLHVWREDSVWLAIPSGVPGDWPVHVEADEEDFVMPVPVDELPGAWRRDTASASTTTPSRSKTGSGPGSR